jgi:formylglycine-generating enzyme required for sulfatase activity
VVHAGDPVDSADSGEGAEAIYFTFIVFPAGEYEIGSPEDEPERNDEPRRRVRLTRGFALSDRPVTWRQFDAFDGGSHRAAWSRQFGRELGDDDPVFGVNWFESVAYCRWLTSQSGLSESDQAYGPEPLEREQRISGRAGWSFRMRPIGLCVWRHLDIVFRPRRNGRWRVGVGR